MDPPDILTRPLQSSSSSGSRLAPPQTASSPYSRAHSLPSVSPALNHAHSMEAATPPAPPASAVAAASEAAAAASASSLPPPGLDAWMHTQFKAAFHKQMQKIDFDDLKGNKHQLPLARIKKIMKSDEDVRMISAEAPILFAKACVCPTTALLRSDGTEITAGDVAELHAAGTPVTLIDEYGLPTLVTGVLTGYDTVPFADPRFPIGAVPALVARVPPVAPVPAHRAAKSMFAFDLVDYVVEPGLATHNRIVLTGDHEVMLLCSAYYKARTKCLIWHVDGPGRGRHWPAGPVDSARAGGGASAAADLAAGPYLWRVRADDFHDWLMYGHPGQPGHNVRLVPVPAAGLPPGLSPLAMPGAVLPGGGAIPAGQYDDGDGSEYIPRTTRNAFAFYSPSARSWQAADGSRGNQAGNAATRQLPIPQQPRFVDAGAGGVLAPGSIERGPTAIRFDTQPMPVSAALPVPGGLPQPAGLRQLLLCLFWPDWYAHEVAGAAAPAGGHPLRTGLTAKVAYCLGLWLSDGDSSRPAIGQAEDSNTAERHSHEEAVDKVRDTAKLMLARLPVPAGAAPFVAAAWSRDLEGQYHAGCLRVTCVPPGAAAVPVLGPLVGAPPGYAPFGPVYPPYAGPTFRGFSHQVPSTGNHVWMVYPGLVNWADPRALWFRQVLSALGIICALGQPSRKRIPMALLTDTCDVRRCILAGFIDGDGSFDERRHMYQVTAARAVSYTLVNDIMHLCRGLGYGVGGRTNTIKVEEDGTRHHGVAFNIQGVPDRDHSHAVPTQMLYKQAWSGREPDPHFASWSVQRGTDYGNAEMPRTQALGASHDWVSITTAQSTMLTGDHIVLHNCEMFIMELTLRAYAYTEHAPSKRRTLQRNDIAAAIQNAEIFDFLHEIVPVLPQDPSEEGTPPHRSPDETTRTRRLHATPDVLLERPLLDPYGDALPVPVHQHLAHRASRQHSAAAAAAANAAAVAQAAQEASAHASQPQYAAYASRGYSGLTPDSVLAPSMDPSAYGMMSMSRGSSLDLMGVGPASAVMSTPNFGGGAMAIEQLPDAPPDTPNTGNNAGSTLTPLPPQRRPVGLSGSIHSPALSNLTPPTMLSPHHSGMPQSHPHAAAQMQMQYHAQQHMLQQQMHAQHNTPQLHTLPATPGAAFFPQAGLQMHTPANQAYLQLQQQQQHHLHTQWLEQSNGGGGGGVAVPPSPHPAALAPSVSTPSSSSHTLSTPMFSGYSAEGSIDDDEQQ